MSLTAVKVVMFQRPRTRSFLPREPLSRWRAASGSVSGIGRLRRDDTTSPLPGESSTQTASESAANEFELTGRGRKEQWVWNAAPARAPALMDDDTPQRAASWATDSHRPDVPPLVLPFEDALLQAAPPFVCELVHTWHDCHRPRMVVGYDDGAALVIDFARQQVQADARAWERLLARGELPRRSDGSFSLDAPSHLSNVHPIESLIWAVGLASGNLPLLGAPATWRSARVLSRGWQTFPNLSRAPAHLHLAELASQGETTPDQLRRATRVDERDLRAFLQAALFLRLLEWSR